MKDAFYKDQLALQEKIAVLQVEMMELRQEMAALIKRVSRLEREFGVAR